VKALTKSGRCEGRQIPLRMPMGGDSVQVSRAVLEVQTKSLDAWADLASTTDHDDVVKS
jgi:hypothetical protein